MIDYRGKHDRTKSNRLCLPWTRVSPSSTIWKFPNDETTEDAMNFCRNPNRTSVGPWCFVEKVDRTVESELCDLCPNFGNFSLFEFRREKSVLSNFSGKNLVELFESVVRQFRGESDRLFVEKFRFGSNFRFRKSGKSRRTFERKLRFSSKSMGQTEILLEKHFSNKILCCVVKSNKSSVLICFIENENCNSIRTEEEEFFRFF